MINKIKSFFSSLTRDKKIALHKQQLILAVLFFVFLGIILPFQSAKAFIQILPTLLIGGAILAALQLVILISHLFLGLAGAILGWVLSGNFITLPYTHGEVVDVSWGLVKDLTNMLFIIILIFIGLATALRIREYEAKKALPLLIIIALLINFTPVICGAIVDAANIVMNFFLKAVAGGNVLGANLFKEYKLVWDGLTPLDIINPLADFVILLKSLTIIIFNFAAAFIFIAFTFLFVIRFIAIWVLVILSPLAFFSYILPATRKIWNMWWNQFIQWTFIGVTAAFFLYLGLNTITILGTVQEKLGTIPNVGWLEGELIEFFNKMLPLGIGMVFLLLAFFMGLSTGAMGGSQIVGLAKTSGKKIGGWTKNVAERRAVGPAAGKIAQGLGAAATWSGRLGEKNKALGMFAKPLHWATRAAVPALTEYAAKKRRVSLPDGWKQMSIPEKERYINSLSLDSDKLVLASEMKGEDTFQKTSGQFQNDMHKKADKFKGDARYKKETSDIFDALPDKVTKQIRLEYELAGIKDTTERGRIKTEFQNNINKIITEFGFTKGDITHENTAAAILHARSLKPKAIAEVTKSHLTQTSFQLAMQKMSSAHLQAIQNNFDEQTVRRALEENKGLNTIKSQAELKAIYDKNPRLVRWAFETPGGKEMLNWASSLKKPY